MLEKLEGILEWGGTKRKVTLLIISAIALGFSIVHPVELPFDATWVAVILCGIPIILEAVIGLVTRFDIKADVLVSIALIASILTKEDFAAGEVAFIMQLGSLLEDLTVAKARAGIEKLVNLTPQTARLINNGKEEIVAADKVKIGDIIRVIPGESIPVDGEIISGHTSVNQAVMTGESLPVDKAAGDTVSSGTVNQYGAFEMRATKVGKDSSIQRMIKLVQSADADKAEIVGLADKWATWIVIAALSAALFTWLFTGEAIRAVTILVVFCPCSLVLATPTAIMAAIGNVTKHGFLVREGDALERLAKVSKISFDKTGTLTYGKPQVLEVKSCNPVYSKDEVYSLTASVEQYSEHPLGKAVIEGYKLEYNKKIDENDSFKVISGKGVYAIVGDRRVLSGNSTLLAENNITIEETALPQIEEYLSKGCTIIYTAVDNALAGYIVLSDTLRKESSSMISRLKALGIDPVLLTGDNKNAANSIAEQLKIDNVYSDCLPEDKLNIINDYQMKNQFVCMIGDGINDAPALKKSTVGIAMGGIGSDIAIDAADIALVDDEVKELPHLFALSKRMMSTIKFNLSFSMLLNFIAIILAITGALNPVVGALVHNAGSVFVIINSSLLLRWRLK